MGFSFWDICLYIYIKHLFYISIQSLTAAFILFTKQCLRTIPVYPYLSYTNLTYPYLTYPYLGIPVVSQLVYQAAI